MKLQRNELIVVTLIIGYISFFTHPPPSHITNLLESPVGHAIFLLGILYVIAYQSLVVGIFLGIAYIMTSSSVFEHLTTFASYAQTPEIVDQGVARFGQDTRSMTKINEERLARGETPFTKAEFKEYRAKQVKSAQERATKNKITSNGVPSAPTSGLVGSNTSGSSSSSSGSGSSSSSSSGSSSSSSGSGSSSSGSGSSSSSSGSGSSRDRTIDLSELKGMDLSKRLIVKPASTSSERFRNFAAF